MKEPEVRVKQVSGRGLQKLSLSEHLAEHLKEEMTAILQEKGRVYLCYLKKEYVGYVLIEKTTARLSPVYASEQEVVHLGESVDNTENTENTETTESKEVPVYRLRRCVLLPGYEEHLPKVQEYLVAELKEMSVFEGCEAVIWEEEIYQQRKVKVGSAVWFAGPFFGICMAILWGIVFDNFALGICFGVCFGSMMGLTWTQAGKKK